MYKSLRIMINDYAGHPFPVQLSRALAQRGYRVLHTYCASVRTPRGALVRQEDDPESFDIRPIHLAGEFQKYSLISRWRQEKELGRKLVDVARRYKPTLIISSNTPLGAQAALVNMCRDEKIKFVFWVQDVLGVGISKAVQKRVVLVGRLIGVLFEHYERSLWKKSDEIILITEDFLPYFSPRLVQRNRISIIENWAPLDELPLLPKTNDWSREHGLDKKFCLLYAGTLGMKHNPELLLHLAIHLQDRQDIKLVVISEGLGLDVLKKEKAYHGLDNLILMGFQPFEVLPRVLATADGLLAILEPDAGVFAVPSKVLTYLCANRPLLLAVPSENLAARIVRDNAAGIVVSPTNAMGFINAADKLIFDSALRASLAENGLAYARKTFDIKKITDRFEEIIRHCASTRDARSV